MGPQSRESPKCGNPGTKWHLDVDPVARHKVYYKGEGGGFPQVQAVVSLVSVFASGLFVHQSAPTTQ